MRNLINFLLFSLTLSCGLNNALDKKDSNKGDSQQPESIDTYIFDEINGVILELPNEMTLEPDEEDGTLFFPKSVLQPSDADGNKLLIFPYIVVLENTGESVDRTSKEINTNPNGIQYSKLNRTGIANYSEAVFFFYINESTTVSIRFEETMDDFTMDIERESELKDMIYSIVNSVKIMD